MTWSKRLLSRRNGIRCNANIVLASVGAKIPANGAVQALAEWGNEFLTTSQVIYKGGDQ